MRALALSAAVLAVLVVVSTAGGSTAPSSWQGFVAGSRPTVNLGDRMIVVLKAPSLAQRLAHAHYATETQERTWTAQALAAQQQVLTVLAIHGIIVRPDFQFARVLDGFSAALDPRAVQLLQNDADVAGVYPVRAAFPASISGHLLQTAAAARPTAGLPGLDGRGVTIALLDTGVDLSHAYVRGRVEPGLDLVSGHQDASAQADPQDREQVERHGTELAGILVGAGGPAGLHGVAPGATVFPIRVAGWQPDANGTDAVYGRSDQLIAGLDRAVDPNGDGDAHDAASVALVGVTEPYAAFGDGPEATAVQGALDLGTVVVAPAGNDGAAGPAFGSVGSPAAVPGAVAVSAEDSRPVLRAARVVLRRGLDIVFDREQPLLGPVAPGRALTLTPAASRAGRFFDGRGNSLVAGRAAVAPLGNDPNSTVAAAAAAGARAVVLYSDTPPPEGALPVAETTAVPAAWVPTAAAAALLAAGRAGIDVGISIGPGRTVANSAAGVVAAFSSQGLAFDGQVKPDLAAPGVGIATAEPGTAADGSPLYGTVNGTSAAAAVVAGAAALLTELRPGLSATDLRSLLVGYAEPTGAPVAAVGAGTLDAGASAVAELTADQDTLTFGAWGGARWHATRSLVIRNVSSRRLQLSISAATTAGSPEALHFRVVPDRVSVDAGKAARLRITVTAPLAPNVAAAFGAIRVSAVGSETLRVPWSLIFERPSTNLLQRVSLVPSTFAPSDTSPALLTMQVGGVDLAAGTQIEPVARLDVLLYDAAGRYLGVMARERDLLPGAYTFGITGRGPTSSRLSPGRYELRVAAWPTLPLQAKPSRATVSFEIE